MFSALGETIFTLTFISQAVNMGVCVAMGTQGKKINKIRDIQKTPNKQQQQQPPA